ncbi:MAG: M15 family metallopeptidase [Prevotella sp.]|nr:M15 family metallopeptidase [Prevotella sp.]
MVLSVSHVQAMTSAEREALTKWKAGAIVSRQAAEEFGLKNCFKAEQIPDGVWQRMQGKSYKKNPYIGRNDLRHIRVLHWGADDKIHLGEMICNKIIADKLVTIFRKLFDNKYAIERMVLPDEYDGDDERQMQKNNSSCFCYRAVAGSKTLSKHARGLAVDINPLYNPYVKKRGNVIVKIQPTTARDYEDRTKKFPFKIDKSDLCYRLFIEQGFRWGGAWRTVKDYQHFEY